LDLLQPITENVRVAIRATAREDWIVMGSKCNTGFSNTVPKNYL
jgi:hypothetical protein